MLGWGRGLYLYEERKEKKVAHFGNFVKISKKKYFAFKITICHIYIEIEIQDVSLRDAAGVDY